MIRYAFQQYIYSVITRCSQVMCIPLYHSDDQRVSHDHLSSRVGGEGEIGLDLKGRGELMCEVECVDRTFPDDRYCCS